MGRFVSGPCTGLTGQDTQCSSCKTHCADDEYIKGTCSGTTLMDTTECTACTPRPSNLHYTKNPCNGRSREDQVMPFSFCVEWVFLLTNLVMADMAPVLPNLQRWTVHCQRCQFNGCHPVRNMQDKLPAWLLHAGFLLWNHLHRYCFLYAMLQMSTRRIQVQP